MRLQAEVSCRLPEDSTACSYVGEIVLQAPTHGFSTKLAYSFLGPDPGDRVFELRRPEAVVASYHEQEPVRADPLPRQALLGILGTWVMSVTLDLEEIHGAMRQEGQYLSEGNVRKALEATGNRQTHEADWGPFPGFNEHDLLTLLTAL